jgi:hypothetical protein
VNAPAQPAEFDESDVTTAVEALDRAPFRTRVIDTQCNAADPNWMVGGRPIADHVRDQMDVFKGELDVITSDSVHAGAFHHYTADTWHAVGTAHLGDVVAPTPADLLHVYGPDRDNVGDWRRYYRYAWKDKGPNGIVFSDDASIVRQGALSSNCYSYTGQNSFTLVGAGMLYRPEWGDAKISIRPFTQWQTSASFTGSDKAFASASASVGIFVQSWKASGGGGELVDCDITVPVWSQTTKDHLTGVASSGAATVGDGLGAELFAVTQRKYGIFVYSWLETSVGPQLERNELRFTTIDMNMTVPYVVVEETLV